MVDAELEGEVKSECLKFGFVEKVSIFENRNGVRVFVKFNNSDAATNGFYFILFYFVYFIQKCYFLNCLLICVQKFINSNSWT